MTVGCRAREIVGLARARRQPRWRYASDSSDSSDSSEGGVNKMSI